MTMENMPLVAQVRFVDAHRGERVIPDRGTFADEVVVTSLTESWVGEFPTRWFGTHPFDVVDSPVPAPADLDAIHRHFDRCPGLLRIGPVVTVLHRPAVSGSSFRIENPFRTAVRERTRSPGKMLVAGRAGLAFDYFPQPVTELAALGFSFVEERSVSHWDVAPETLEPLGQPCSCVLEPWQAVIFPPSVLLTRVRLHDPHLLAYGYFRGLHPATRGT